MYWLHDRDFSQDHYGALSRALVAATTDPTVLTPPDAQTAHDAAALASQTVNLIGNRTDIPPDEFTDGPAAKNLATILSTYMNGVDQMGAVNDVPWDKGDALDQKLQYFDGTQLNVPKFNEASVKNFIALAASSKDGFTTLRGGVDAFADRKYSLALDTLANDPTNQTAKDNFKKAYTSQALLEGLFTRAVGDSAIAGAKGKDAASARWVALGENVVRIVPFGSFVTNVGGGELTKAVVNFTVNQARGATADAAAARWGNATGAELDTQEKIAKQAQDNAEYTVLTALAAHPTLLGKPLPDSEWSPGGQLLSLDAMGGFGSNDWSQAKDQLLSNDDGVGTYYDKKAFDEAYKDAFIDFYPKQ
jgi:hypothetical protein